MAKIIIKNSTQLANIRHAGKLLTELHYLLYTSILPGVRLDFLEIIARDFLSKNKVYGTFRGYNGFPANLCLSINDCLVHGIPDQTVLKSGDLLKVDVGVTHQGCIADAAFSIVVGGDTQNRTAALLIQATKYALDTAVPLLKPGNTLYPFGEKIEQCMTDAGFSVIKDLTGHGVGIKLHEAPYIYNFSTPKLKQTIIRPGMVFALEPITGEISESYRDHTNNKKPNGRNLYTKHGDLGCQREYTVIITPDGPEIVAGMTSVPEKDVNFGQVVCMKV